MKKFSLYSVFFVESKCSSLWLPLSVLVGGDVLWCIDFVVRSFYLMPYLFFQHLLILPSLTCEHLSSSGRGLFVI